MWFRLSVPQIVVPHRYNKSRNSKFWHTPWDICCDVCLMILMKHGATPSRCSVQNLLAGIADVAHPSPSEINSETCKLWQRNLDIKMCFIHSSCILEGRGRGNPLLYECPQAAKRTEGSTKSSWSQAPNNSNVLFQHTFWWWCLRKQRLLQKRCIYLHNDLL